MTTALTFLTFVVRRVKFVTTDSETGTGTSSAVLGIFDEVGNNLGRLGINLNLKYIGSSVSGSPFLEMASCSIDFVDSHNCSRSSVMSNLSHAADVLMHHLNQLHEPLDRVIAL